MDNFKSNFQINDPDFSTPENHFGKQVFPVRETAESVKLIKFAILAHLQSVKNSF